MTRAELLLTFLSWAAHLSGYSMQDEPLVLYVPHSFFVEYVCNQKECNVRGWYNDDDIVYIDERNSDLNNWFNASLVTHEFTHYLQDKSGEWPQQTCENFVAREREAYHVQQRYIFEALARIDILMIKPITC